MKVNLIFLVLCVPMVRAIIGGVDRVKDGSYRYVVSIMFRGSHICGGVLYGPQFVLTAATCVKDKKLKHLKVMANATDFSDPTAKFFKIDRVISKNAFGKDEVRDDIAVLRLAEHYQRTQCMAPIGFPPPDDRPDLDDELCTFLGWGQKEIGSNNGPSKILQMAMTKTVNLDECRKYNSDVDESHICTYDKTARLCNFDTGDILEGYQSLWGIATKQHECHVVAPRNFPYIFTRMSFHRDWIEETVEENTDPIPNPNSSSEHKLQMIVIGISLLLIISFN